MNGVKNYVQIMDRLLRVMSSEERQRKEATYVCQNPIASCDHGDKHFKPHSRHWVGGEALLMQGCGREALLMQGSDKNIPQQQCKGPCGQAACLWAVLH